jgi:hypothetical protein
MCWEDEAWYVTTPSAIAVYCTVMYFTVPQLTFVRYAGTVTECDSDCHIGRGCNR